MKYIFIIIVLFYSSITKAEPIYLECLATEDKIIVGDIDYGFQETSSNIFFQFFIENNNLTLIDHDDYYNFAGGNFELKGIPFKEIDSNEINTIFHYSERVCDTEYDGLCGDYHIDFSVNRFSLDMEMTYYFKNSNHSEFVEKGIIQSYNNVFDPNVLEVQKFNCKKMDRVF